MPDLGLPDGPCELGHAIRGLSRAFDAAGLRTAALDARLLASHACALSPEETIANPRLLLSPEMTAQIKEAALRRLAGEPVSRIAGRREFWGLPFGLSPETLDPRPETELLVEAVLDYAHREGLQAAPLRVLDLGTGSGCLLAAVLSELPRARGVGVDLSEEAVDVARENLRDLGLLNRASFLCANWLGAFCDASFDVIVCNPPYIESSEIARLDREVRDFDPLLALDGGEDGLEAYRAIFAQAFRVLRNKGFLVFETGYRQAQAVCAMMVAASEASSCQARILCDLSGAKRAVAGERQSMGREPGIKKKVGNPACSG